MEDDIPSRNERSKSSLSKRNGDVDGRRDGRGKYSNALQTFIPYRRETSKMAGFLPSGHSGLFSFISFGWLTPIMWKAFRQGLTPADLWRLHENDKAEPNAKRLNRIWQEEKELLGPNASFMKAIWKFGKTRFYVCICLMIVSIIFQFLGPSVILRQVLSFQDDFSQPLDVGIALAILAFLAQLIRNLTYHAVWSIGIHTGMRVEGALQFMSYEKMLRLRNSGENILSKTITFCTNDQERIFECISGAVLAVAAPMMFLFCIVYTCIVLGPWALLGNLVIFLFYPVMGAVAARTAMIRRKAVKFTNKRVGLMTEIMNSIRLIKMYGWEESFLAKISEIRSGEENLLRTAAFLQSVSCTITPMINIVASVVVFIAYTLSGNNITPSEVFTIFSVFSAMSFTFGTLPFALRAIGEASISFKNFQKFLELPEFEVVTDPDMECEHDAVIAIREGHFSWEIEKVVEDVSAPPKRKPKRSFKAKASKSKENGANGTAEVAEAEVLTGEKPQEDPVILEECLKDINLQVKRGSLIGVCGPVGAGKSALLSAVLGDLVKTSGKILIRGSLAIVPQQAWIYSDTLQENILFGSPMHKEKYDKVLDSCCLRPDIAALSNGDLTIVGERGVNLSGGQKQRINLARAVYADKSILLMDDPLSAVDSIISKDIFEKCIKTHLKEKTVVLVTNGIQFLEQCDNIVFIKNGEIVERGTHEQLIVTKGHYFGLLQYHNQNESKTEEAIPLISNEMPEKLLYESPTKKPKGPMGVEVESFSQKVIEDDSQYKFAGTKAYLRYIQAAGGYLLFFVLLSCFLLFGLAKMSSQLWLQRWLDAGDGNGTVVVDMEEGNITSDITEPENINDTFALNENVKLSKGYVNENPDLWFYQLILVVIIIVSFLIGLVKGFMSSRFVVRGASSLHSKMLTRVMTTRMAFFDATPVGKITTRFSKDMDELDARLPFFFEFVIQSVIYVMLSLLIPSVIYPIFAVVMIFVVVLIFWLDLSLNIGVRETRKLESVLKTPVIHHLQSSSNGLSIIRTYHRQDPFKARFSSYLNSHLAAETVYRSANRWFTFRMDSLGVVTIFGVMLVAVLLRGSVSPALVGLALSSIYSVCIFVPFVMRMKSELQARFLSVERILEYCEELEQEEVGSKPGIQPHAGWCSNPDIKFDGVSLRYNEDLPLVISNVSFVINSGEKVGIVGRTGAGKTSILASLLRLYPLEKGKIIVDGLDINEISLKTLRSHVAVIPQDPSLFQGTLRYNLDPFNLHSDEELWGALEKSNIKAKIEKEERKLLQPVSSEGENFSVGEKQLICLARALLRKNKILLLDEATASLDIQTDFLIQNTVREMFRDCTVITIAHRLNTISSYDRILVMDKGEVLEFDTPKTLMDNSKSRFHQMMLASGISSLDQLQMQQDSVDEDGM